MSGDEFGAEEQNRASGGAHPQDDLDEAREIASDLGLSYSGEGRVDVIREWSDRQALQALSHATRLIASTLDLSTLVEQILDLAIQILGAERGILFLGRGADQGITPVVARSISGSDLNRVEQVSRTILAHAMSGRAISSDDACADPLLHGIPSISLAQIRSIACVPLIARGETRGVLYLDNRPRSHVFSEAARRLLQAFADLAAVALENAELHGEMLRENVRLRRRVEVIESFGRMRTINPRMIALLEQANLVAQAEAPIMILGESGTGKEVLARAIHEAGPRAQQPFLAHNCAAVPGQLMESLFFGHVRGAFTGAVRDSQGLFRLAHRGVLFLDEVADLDLSLQAKLLRVIEDGRIRPVGGDEEAQVDVRLITATSRDLQEAIAKGLFRAELFFRTNVLELNLPPLRERADDIPILVDHFLQKHDSGLRPRLQFSSDTLAWLQGLPWPGNVRQLESFIRRAMVLCSGPVVRVQDVRRLLGSSVSTGAMGQGGGSAKDLDSEALLSALRQAGGNKSEAARQLGLHRNALLRRLKQMGLSS